MRRSDMRAGAMRAWTAVLVTALFVPAAAGAAKVHGVRFEERVTTGSGASLDLCAAELLRYKRIFRGYVAALYLEDCERRAEALADVPRRLELSYFWSIPGSMFGTAARRKPLTLSTSLTCVVGVLFVFVQRIVCWPATTQLSRTFARKYQMHRKRRCLRRSGRR